MKKRKSKKHVRRSRKRAHRRNPDAPCSCQHAVGAPEGLKTNPSRKRARKPRRKSVRRNPAPRKNPSQKLPTYYALAGKSVTGEGYVFLQDARGMVTKNPLQAKRFRSVVAVKRFHDAHFRKTTGLFIARIRRFPHGISMDKLTN